MRTHTLEQTLYTLPELRELDGSAYSRAIEKLAQSELECGIDLDFEVDTIKEVCATLGVDVTNVYYSIGWSQSDYCAIVGRYSYRKGALAELKKEFPTWTELHTVARELQDAQRKAFYQAYAVLESGRSSQKVSVSHDDYNKDITQECEDDITDAFRSLASIFEHRLRAELEYRTSEECILENANANGWEFDEDGNLA